MLKTVARILLITVVFLVTGSGCYWVSCTPPPAAPCDIEALLVDESVFPAGWREQGPPRSKEATASFGVEKIGTGFSGDTHGVAIQDVYRSSRPGVAAAGYEDFMSFFSIREDETDWALPSELRFRSEVADQFRLGCSTHSPSGAERCQFLGQYDVYLVKFHTGMSPDLMTYEDLERILQDIDRRMVECLEQ